MAIQVICDKCSQAAIGYIVVGYATGQRKFDLCPKHFDQLGKAIGGFFGTGIPTVADINQQNGLADLTPPHDLGEGEKE